MDDTYLVLEGFGYSNLLAAIAPKRIDQFFMTSFLGLVLNWVKIAGGCRLFVNKVHSVIYLRQDAFRILFVLAQSVDACHTFHVSQNILCGNFLEAGLLYYNFSYSVIQNEVAIEDDSPATVSVVVKPPYVLDAFFQSSIYIYLTMCGVFPFWFTEPSHFTIGIIIGAYVVFETYTISRSPILSYGIYLQGLRLSIEQNKVF